MLTIIHLSGWALFILFIFHFTSFGQKNEVLIDTTKLWSNLEQAAPGGPPPYWKITHYIKFSGDSLINSVHYKKLYKAFDVQHQVWSLAGLIREDFSSKVYYIPSGYTNERLLYNFNLAVGDTAHIWTWGLHQNNLIVTNIDYIYVYNS